MARPIKDSAVTHTICLNPIDLFYPDLNRRAETTRFGPSR